MSELSALQVQSAVIDCLTVHFDRSTESLRPEQISDQTAIDQPAVERALTVLHRSGQIQGTIFEEYDYPTDVTGLGI